MKLKKHKLITAVALVVITSIATPNKIYASDNHKTVFIDVGHGGRDNGSSYKCYVEDNINLEISKLVAHKLEKEKINVKLSRETDKYLSLAERTSMANNSDADLFISIHQNASEDKSPNGIETLYMGDNELLAKEIQTNLIEATEADNRGHKRANLQVLRDNELPAVLIECGFISNPQEGYKLSTKEYQEKIANGIVEGIKEYLGVDSPYYKTLLEQSKVQYHNLCRDSLCILDKKLT